MLLSVRTTLPRTFLSRASLTQTKSKYYYHSEALDKWIKNPPTTVLKDTLHYEGLSDLYITLSTRDGSRREYEEPIEGKPVPYGTQLAFFHARKPEHLLREDGTDEEISPPAPFLRRMWAGGRMEWDNSNRLLVGDKVVGRSSVQDVKLKGVEKGKPMVFVTQRIAFEKEGNHSFVEDRAHVYFAVKEDEEHVKKPAPRAIEVPNTSDFSFTYLPTPVTLFRFSALMFNAHHIHLDKYYSQVKEGYPERLVHGPLTSLMLLETVAFHKPDVRIKSFDYRATNPMIVDRKATIHGIWTSAHTAQMWCIDDQGVVGMTGNITIE